MAASAAVSVYDGGVGGSSEIRLGAGTVIPRL